MESHEFGVAFLDDEGAEGEAEGDVVECEGFRVVRQDGGGNRDFERRCHGCISMPFEGPIVDSLGSAVFNLLLYGVFLC